MWPIARQVCAYPLWLPFSLCDPCLPGLPDDKREEVLEVTFSGVIQFFGRSDSARSRRADECGPALMRLLRDLWRGCTPQVMRDLEDGCERLLFPSPEGTTPGQNGRDGGRNARARGRGNGTGNGGLLCFGLIVNRDLVSLLIFLGWWVLYFGCTCWLGIGVLYFGCTCRLRVESGFLF